MLHRAAREFEVGVAREIGRHDQGCVDQSLGHAALHLRGGFVAHAGQDVAGQDQLGFTGGDSRRMKLIGTIGDPHVRDDRAILLGEAGHVENRHALAFEVRGHAK